MCLVSFVLPQVTFDQIRFWSTGSCGHIHPKPWICHIGETMWNMGCWLGLLMNSNRRHQLVIWIPLSLGTTCVSLNFVQHTQNKTHQSAIIVLSQQTYWQDALDLNCKSYIIHNARSAETAETAGVSTSLSCCHPGAHSSESATIGTFGLEVRDGCGKWRWKVNTKKGVGQKIQKIKYPYETKG